MKKSSNLKRLFSFMLAVAMVFSMFNLTPQTAEAAKTKKITSVVIKTGDGKTVTKKTITLNKGKTKKLVVTASPKANVGKITFKSSNNKVAKVGSKGKITAVKAGTAKITVSIKNKANGKTKKSHVNVKVVVPVTSVTAKAGKTALTVGDTTTVTATVKPSTASNKTVTFASSNSKVLTVGPKGKVTAVGAGSAKVTVTTKDGAKKATVNFTVKEAEVPVTGIEATIDPAEIVVGKTAQVTATVVPANATDKTIVYASSDEKVATVDEDGVVTGVAVGEATITATSANSKTATVKVTVNPVAVEKITMPETLELTEKDTKALEAVVTPENATDASVTYTSSDEKIATVDEKGTVTAVLAGTATITAASVQNPEVTATCKVTVKELPLAVESVNGINQRLIQVTFNKEVDKASAINANNYAIDGVKVASPNYIVFGTDKKSVNIYLTTSLKQDQKITVSISNILSANTYNKAENCDKEIVIRDIANPVLSKAELKNGNKELYLTFNEALDASNVNVLDSYTLNSHALSTFGASSVAFDQSVAADTSLGTAQDLTNVVKITFASAISAAEYTVAVKADKLKDPAGFFAVNQSAQFTAVADTTALSVLETTATTGNPGTVEVKFNKELGTLLTTYAVNATLNLTPTLKSGTKDTIVISATVAEGANIVVIPAAQKDAFGNKIGETDLRISVNAVKDTVKPTVESVYALTDKKVRVKFSENVNVAPFVTAKANYTIKDSTGTVVYSSSVSTAKYTITGNADDDNKLVDITFDDALPESNYTLEIKGVKDGSGNEMDAYSTSFVSPDKTAPTLAATGNKAVINATANTVEIFFSEQMNSTTITNKANYLYKTAATAYTSLPASATIEAGTGNKSVKITFPSTVKVNAITDINVLNVTDAAGNLINGGAAATGTPATTLGVDPKIVESSAKVVADSDKVTLTFETDQQLTKIDKADFVSFLKGTGINVATAPDTATISGKVVTLTYNSANANYPLIKACGDEISLDSSFSATTAGGTGGTTNTYGDKLTTSGVSTNGLKVKDQIAPELVANANNPIKVATKNTITLQFNEAISNENLGELKDDVTVTTNGAYTTITGAAVTADTITLTTKDSLEFNVTLNFVAANISVKDAAGNAFVPTTANKNLWKVDLTSAPAAVATKTADADLGASVGLDTATKITIAGTDVTLTNIKALGTTYNAAAKIDTVITELQADINAVSSLNGKYNVSKSSSKLVITTAATGVAASVDLTGSDTDTGATLLGFTTLTAVNGTDATSSTTGNFAQ